MRNNSLDILKFVCAILVIFIHTPQIDNIEYIIDPLQRCAVPIFFIISGYFTCERTGLNKILKKRAISILKIFCWAYFLCIISNTIHYSPAWVVYITIQNIGSFFFYNNTILGEHLWYIHSYLYILILIWGANKYNFHKLILYATPILIIAGLFLGKYHEIITGNNIPIYYSRNFLFTGLPFFIIGILIKKSEKIINLYISYSTIIIGIILFLITGAIEEFALGLYDNIGDLYISNVFMSIAIFILFCKTNCENENALSKMGREDCLYIYIFHWFFITEISLLMEKLGYEELFKYTSIIVIPIITIIFIKILRKTQIIGRLI